MLWCCEIAPEEGDLDVLPNSPPSLGYSDLRTPSSGVKPEKGTLLTKKGRKVNRQPRCFPWCRRHKSKQPGETGDPEEAGESLIWLTQVVESVWPHINEVLEKFARSRLEPALRRSVPSFLSNIHFESFYLGSHSPRLGPVKVYRYEKATVAQIHLHLAPEDTNIVLAAGGAKFGLQALEFSGDLQLEFSNFLDVSPVVGAIKIYFMRKPQIAAKFKGLGGLLNFPQLQGVIERVLDAQIANTLLYPKFKVIRLGRNTDVDAASLSQPLPIGVLRVQVIRAEKLTPMDTALFGQGTSDPYVTLLVAGKVWKSQVVYKDLNPTWPATEANVCFLPVNDVRQTLYLEVLDEDLLKADDLIGVPQEDLTMGSFMESNELLERSMDLYLDGQYSGSLYLETQYFPIKRDESPTEFYFFGFVMEDIECSREFSAEGLSIRLELADQKLETGEGWIDNVVAWEEELNLVIYRMKAQNFEETQIADLLGVSVADVRCTLQDHKLFKEGKPIPPNEDVCDEKFFRSFSLTDLNLELLAKRPKSIIRYTMQQVVYLFVRAKDLCQPVQIYLVADKKRVTQIDQLDLREYVQKSGSDMEHGFTKNGSSSEEVARLHYKVNTLRA